MYQTLCADMHGAVFACAGQLLGKVKHEHAGWTVPINIS